EHQEPKLASPAQQSGHQAILLMLDFLDVRQYLRVDEGLRGIGQAMLVGVEILEREGLARGNRLDQEGSASRQLAARITHCLNSCPSQSPISDMVRQANSAALLLRTRARTMPAWPAFPHERRLGARHRAVVATTREFARVSLKIGNLKRAV